MVVHCPKCGTFAETNEPAVPVHCAFCDHDFRCSKLEERRFWRQAEHDWLRHAKRPWAIGASIALLVVTLLILLGIAHGDTRRDTVSVVAAYAFPAWVVALTFCAWLIHRTDKIGAFTVTYRTALCTLGVLALPVLYMLLPPSVRPGHVAQRVINIATGDVR